MRHSAAANNQLPVTASTASLSLASATCLPPLLERYGNGEASAHEFALSALTDFRNPEA
jgi:hypothetical protein